MADLNIVIAAHTGQATSEINKVRSGLQSLDGQMKKSARGNNVYGKAVSENTRGLSKFAKSGLQQTGYQVGDFAVQVGGGTSALQAFGQQGSQLFGIFGAGGAIFGAVIAVVAAVGNAFLKGAEKAQDFGSATEDLTTATNNFKRSVDLTFIESIEEKYGKITKSVTKLVNAQRVLQQVQEKAAFKKVQSTLTETVATFDKVIERQRRLTSEGSDLSRPYQRLASQFGDSTKSIGKEFGLAGDMLGVFGRKIEAVASSSTKKQLEDNVAAVLAFIAQNGGATTDAMIELKASMDQLVLSGLALGDVPVKKLGEDAKEAAEELDKAALRTKGAADVAASSFGEAFTDIVMGTKRTKDAFASMASSIISQLLQILVVQDLVGAVGSKSNGVVTPGKGLAGLFSGTLHPAPPGKAIGGSVQGNSTYLVGERGPELFMPNSSGSIVPNNKMGGGGGVTVNQTINISTGVSQTVRAEIAQLMPQISNSAKAAVLDAKQRGGSFSKAF
jgi:hypothetical protein